MGNERNEQGTGMGTASMQRSVALGWATQGQSTLVCLEPSINPPWLHKSISMATLTKSQPASDDNLVSLPSSIPAPFSSADRAYILRSSHSNYQPHPITSTSAALEHPPRTKETQVFGEVALNAGTESPTATRVSIVLGLHRPLILDL